MSNIQDAKPNYIKLTSTILSTLQKKPLDAVTAKEWNTVLRTIIKVINENARSSNVALDYIKDILNGKVDFKVDINAKTLEGHTVDDFILKDSLDPFTAIKSAVEHNRHFASFEVTKREEDPAYVSKSFYTSYEEKVPQYYFLYLTKDDNGDPTIGIITIGGATSDYGTVLNETYIGDVFDTNTLFKIPQYSYFAFMYSAPPDTISDIEIDSSTVYYNEHGVPDWEIGVVHNTAEYQDFVRHIFSLVSATGAPSNYVSKSIDYSWEYNGATLVSEDGALWELLFTVHLQDGTTKLLRYGLPVHYGHSELLYLATNSYGDLYIASEELPFENPVEEIDLSYVLDPKHDFRSYIAYTFVTPEPPVRNLDFNGGRYKANFIGAVLNPHKDTILARQFIDRLYNEMRHNQMYKEYSQLFN